MNSQDVFAVRVFVHNEVLLTPHKIYRVIPDENAERSDYVRIVDDEGEDYLYPKKYFMFVSLPSDIENATLRPAQI